MSKLKHRRLYELIFQNHPDLHVGQCVPFYFCPRFIMLYIMHKGNHPEVGYIDGQEPIVHLVADLKRVVQWANQNDKRWAFTTGNAGSYYFEDYAAACKKGEVQPGKMFVHKTGAIVGPQYIIIFPPSAIGGEKVKWKISKPG